MRLRQLGRTGLRVSIIGFGASPLGNEFGSADPAACRNAVHAAIDHGINFFDVAPYYGRGLAEQRLGEALQGRRDRVILATKFGRYDVNDFDFSAARAQKSIAESLSRLRTDYVDILHAHDIEFGKRRQIIEETLPALRQIQESGKARYIGITGLQLRLLQAVAAESPVDCVLSYCRFNLLNTDLDDSLASFARSREIGLINASPLHMRLLAGDDPPPWHPAPHPVRDAARKIAALCRQRGEEPSAVALRFAANHPDIATTLVGMASTSEVEQNLRALDGRNSPELLRDIEELTLPVKRIIWETGLPENSDVINAHSVDR